MEENKAPIPLKNKRRRVRIFKKKVLRGKNPKFDLATFHVADAVNEVMKLVFPKKIKKKIQQKMLDYVLETMPAYDSAQPLLGSKEDESSLIEYKMRRFLEVAKPCDVILVRGNQRISRIIQTLTQSQYSHSAFYIGGGKIIEAEPAGVMESYIDKYIHLDIRICRPVMLDKKGKKIVMDHMEEMVRLNPKYDITNIEKLLFKYWYTKFRPDTWVYIGGSTEFEKYYICSGVIAHGFHKAGYPIVPSLRLDDNKTRKKTGPISSASEYEKMVKLRKKNFSQIVPADFDNSPFFASIKFLYLDSKISGKRKYLLEEDEEPTTVEENDPASEDPSDE